MRETLLTCCWCCRTLDHPSPTRPYRCKHRLSNICVVGANFLGDCFRCIETSGAPCRSRTRLVTGPCGEQLGVVRSEESRTRQRIQRTKPAVESCLPSVLSPAIEGQCFNFASTHFLAIYRHPRHPHGPYASQSTGRIDASLQHHMLHPIVCTTIHRPSSPALFPCTISFTSQALSAFLLSLSRRGDAYGRTPALGYFAALIASNHRPLQWPSRHNACCHVEQPRAQLVFFVITSRSISIPDIGSLETLSSELSRIRLKGLKTVPGRLKVAWYCPFVPHRLMHSISAMRGLG